MDRGQAVAAIFAGSVLIAVSFIAKRFYAAKGILGSPPTNSAISPWKGRLLFWAIGLFMILVGISFFLSNR